MNPALADTVGSLGSVQCIYTTQYTEMPSDPLKVADPRGPASRQSEGLPYTLL